MKDFETAQIAITSSTRKNCLFSRFMVVTPLFVAGPAARRALGVDMTADCRVISLALPVEVAAVVTKSRACEQAIKRRVRKPSVVASRSGAVAFPKAWALGSYCLAAALVAKSRSAAVMVL